jgi:hypothetical protein
VRNGRCLKSQTNFRTWTPLAIGYDDFERLLVQMHANRVAARRNGRSGPFLSMRDVPADMRSKYAQKDLAEVVSTMASTKFCGLDRYKDFVSIEITKALRKLNGHLEFQVLLSLLVRFRQNPRGMAPAVAKKLLSPQGGTGTAAVEVSLKFKRAVCYRQTGITDVDLYCGVAQAARNIAGQVFYSDWEKLEARIACKMKRYCKGTKKESFSARQVAADLCQVPGFVGSLSSAGYPDSSKLGVGAIAGYYLNERARGLRPRQIKIPKRVRYLRQSGLCEYHKLVSRMNFPHLKQAAAYKG